MSKSVKKLLKPCNIEAKVKRKKPVCSGEWYETLNEFDSTLRFKDVKELLKIVNYERNNA